MKAKGLKLTAAALAMALLMGCTQNQVLATLQASVAATETLVAALQVSGKIDAGVASEIENAIAALPQAYQETTAELASSDADALKSVKIAGYYATTIAALNALPPDAQAYTAAVAASIQAFLADLPQTTGTRAIAPVKASVTKFDVQKLNAIAKEASELSTELSQLQARTAKPAGAAQ